MILLYFDIFRGDGRWELDNTPPPQAIDKATYKSMHHFKDIYLVILNILDNREGREQTGKSHVCKIGI